MSALDKTVALLDRLVAHRTVSSDSNLAMIGDLAQMLDALGAQVELFHDTTGTKANLLARLGPDGPGGLLLSGHTDVVPVADQAWTGDPFTLRARDGRLYGRGTCDMKGFIAAALVTAQDWAARDLHRPVYFALTHDEEVGCLGARALMPHLQARALRPDVTLVGEPTGMQVVEGHKGCCEYTVRFTGRAGHGSAPDRGVNAAEYAVRYVSALMDLRGDLMLRAPKDSRFAPPWTTLNLGRIAGGVAHNVIAETAEVAWEMRPVQDSDRAYVLDRITALVDDELRPLMQALAPEADIVTEIIGEVPGLQPQARNPARDLVAAVTGANGADVVPFGTEAGLFQGLGLPTVICGPGFIDQAHRADEFIALDQLQACLQMLDRLGGILLFAD